MDSWRSDILATLTNLMPYAFSVSGGRAPITNQEAFTEAVGYTNEHVFILMKLAFKAGYVKAMTSNLEVADFVADRAFEAWRHE